MSQKQDISKRTCVSLFEPKNQQTVTFALGNLTFNSCRCRNISQFEFLILPNPSGFQGNARTRLSQRGTLGFLGYRFTGQGCQLIKLRGSFYMMLARAIRASLIAGLVAVPMSPAMAEIQWNGFLSVGAGMTFDDDEKLAGYDNDLSFAPDSILGLQASSDLGENLSVTGQLVARGSTSDVKAEWLYLSYQFNPNLRINIGRQRMPLFLYSDYMDVGYAYHFQRPPTSVYMSPINSIDSVSLLYKRFVGPLDTTLQVWGGSYKENDVEFEGQILDLEITDSVGASLTLVYNNWLTVRGIYSQAKTTITGEGFARVADLGQLAQSVGNHKVAKAMNGEDVGNTFAGLSISAELNDYFFVAEAIQQHMENTDQDTNAF